MCTLGIDEGDCVSGLMTLETGYQGQLGPGGSLVLSEGPNKDPSERGRVCWGVSTTGCLWLHDPQNSGDITERLTVEADCRQVLTFTHFTLDCFKVNVWLL